MGHVLGEHKAVDDARAAFFVAGQLLDLYVVADVHEVVVVFDVGPNQIHALPDQGHDHVKPLGI